MKALTVQQPWAWAIIHGGKDVENRTQAWGYRGPLAIHAGLREDLSALDDAVLLKALFPRGEIEPLADPRPLATRGSILGVVDLVDVHAAEPKHTVETSPGKHLGTPACCESAWAQFAHVEVRQLCEPEPRRIPTVVHLVLENPRPLATPIPCRGQLGLWTPPTDIVGAITRQLEAVHP